MKTYNNTFKHFLKDQGKIFKKTLKMSPHLFYKVFIVDGLFYALIFLVGYMASLYLNTQTQGISLQSLSTEEGIEVMKGILWMVLLVSVLSFLAVSIIYGICKGIIWNLYLKRRITLSHLSHFVLLSSGWLLFWGILILGGNTILIESVRPYFLLIALLLFFYITPIVYIIFAKENRYRHAIFSGLSVSSKLHYFLLPYLGIAGIYILIMLIFNLLPPILGLVFTLLYLVWIREYIVRIVEHVMKYK
ncbi:MAG: hypothetical protein ACLFP2_01095 [Candidatus Woesearchaeota archaeon]